MRAAAAGLLVLLLAACAQVPRRCPPLPELEPQATAEQRANHYAVIVRLYAQCAGAEP